MNGVVRIRWFFFKIPIPLWTLANLSWTCSLKLSFFSCLSSKCFWVFTFSITNLSKKRLGWKESRGFIGKTISWVCFFGFWILELVFFRIKSRFPLFSPSSNFIKVLIQYICCFKEIRNYQNYWDPLYVSLNIAFKK